MAVVDPEEQLELRQRLFLALVQSSWQVDQEAQGVQRSFWHWHTLFWEGGPMHEEGLPPWHTRERRLTGGSRLRGHVAGHDDHDDQEDQPPADSGIRRMLISESLNSPSL